MTATTENLELARKLSVDLYKQGSSRKAFLYLFHHEDGDTSEGIRFTESHENGKVLDGVRLELLAGFLDGRQIL